MRKEASLRLWKELYEVVENIRVLKPWNYLWDTDLIGIILKDEEEPIFCSIMGKESRCFGIGAYEGIEGLRDFCMIATLDETDLPMEYVMYEQCSLMLYWGEKEEVPTEQKSVLKECGFNSRGKDQWPYFLSYKNRYAPCTPDQTEVLRLIDLYKNLFMVIRAVKEKRIDAKFDQGEFLCRTYNEETDLWNIFQALLPKVEKQFPAVVLEDEILRQKLKKRPQIDVEILLDFSYMNASVVDEAYDRPINPLLFIALDDTNNLLITVELLEPKDSEIDMVLSFFVGFTEQHGRVRKIKTRNPWITGALEDICEFCEIPLEYDSLEKMDDIIEDLRNQGMA